MQHDDILQELSFGRPIPFTAPCDLEELEPFQMDGKIYLSGQAIKKGGRISPERSESPRRCPSRGAKCMLAVG